MATSTAQTLHRTGSHVNEYLPESDGKPMAETDVHRNQMIDLLDSLKEYFRADSEVYVTGNIFLYLPREEAEDERKSISPDVFVVFGIEKKDRRIYDMEVEKKAPDVVIELISKSSRYEDTGTKRAIYTELRVREYYIFDPLKEVYPSQLRGFRLQGDEYLPMVGERLQSKLLGLTLVVEKGRLILYDSKTGEKLRTHEESEAGRRAAEAKAAEEKKTREETEKKVAKAEAEIARLRKELARLQKKN
jgi:Uma2 family endonuclease